VTQNVDDLHDRAGSLRLLHMHGELAKARCLACGTVQLAPARLLDGPACTARGLARLRPHIVWFGEVPFEMERSYAALVRCGLFVSIGTSGNVYPAAGFVAEVRNRARTVELNLEPSEGARLFDEARHGPATRLVPDFVAALRAEHGV
jgi:NAD-dependent deacetylase